MYKTLKEMKTRTIVLHVKREKTFETLIEDGIVLCVGEVGRKIAVMFTSASDKDKRYTYFVSSIASNKDKTYTVYVKT